VFTAIDEYAYLDTRSTLWGWPWQNPPRLADFFGYGSTFSEDPALWFIANANTMMYVAGGVAVVALTIGTGGVVLTATGSPILAASLAGAAGSFETAAIAQLIQNRYDPGKLASAAAIGFACGAAEPLAGAAGGALARGGGAAAGGTGREATGFLGHKGFELKNLQAVRNAPAVIGGRAFSGHALDQMQNRGIMPSVVENAIQTGSQVAGKTPGTVVYFDPVNKIRVIVNLETGNVVTVIPGEP
jgi:hypothetical protein